MDVEGATPEARGAAGGAELPRGHAEAVCRAGSSSGRRRRRGGGRSGCARTKRRRQRDGMPVYRRRNRKSNGCGRNRWRTPRYATEDPSPWRKGEEEDEPCAPSPPRWLPEVPPTPR